MTNIPTAARHSTYLLLFDIQPHPRIFELFVVVEGRVEVEIIFRPCFLTCVPEVNALER